MFLSVTFLRKMRHRVHQKVRWNTLKNVSHVMKNFIGNNRRLINTAVVFVGLLFLVEQKFTS
jgi:hypothetical protein